MTLFEELEQAVRRESEQGDLPEYLVEPLLAVARNPQRYAGREQMVTKLVEQVKGYDPYAGAGCFNEGCDLSSIRRTLDALA